MLAFIVLLCNNVFMTIAELLETRINSFRDKIFVGSGGLSIYLYFF